jgi:hypothetical protein
MPVPNFTSGEVLTAGAMNNVGLWLVKTQVVGATVPSVEVTGAFSSNYENYKIIYSGGTSSGGSAITLTLGNSITGYAYSALLIRYADATTLTLNASNGASFGAAGEANTNNNNVYLDVLTPNLARFTTFQGFYVGETLGGATNGIHKVATAYTSFVLAPGSGTMTGGTIRVYGYRN